jgi:oligoendopeptidase F
LEILIDQEQKQLDIYKDFLQKQQEQLEESLNKRKEAYEKYFEAINAQESDEDYQEKSNDLIAKISQLSSSTDASSKKQAAELTQQLEELETERQKELRERAQEAVLNNLDNEVKNISDKFDELLNNEKMLLQALGAEVKNPTFLTQLLASAREDGMTDLQLEQFAGELQSAFGSSIDVSNIKEMVEQVVNNATINVGNQSFDLNTEDGNVV